MMTRKSRRAITFGAGVVGALLVLCSAAFACTVYKGKMTVTGNSSTAGTSTVQGNNSSMGYCQLTPGANAKNSSGTVTITVTSSTNPPCSTTSSLDANTTYDANFVNGAAFAKFPNGPTGVYQWRIDCMSPTGGGVVSLSPSTVTTDGSGHVSATTFSLPNGLTNNNTGEDSAVCLSTSNASNGLQAPVHIVTL